MPLELHIVTPEKKIFSDLVDNVYLPGADGEMGILPQHAGLVTALKPGELRYAYHGTTQTLAIGSGFAEVTQTKVIVLTDSALGEAEIDAEHVEAAIKRAHDKLATIDHNVDHEEVAHLQGIIAKATSDLHFKRKYSR
ncbi:MAG: ATP synthase F1 subunit epsilon [Luteolibacter sp.]|uniref:ATP synthase F1 subunit epsilon n=1 Tax=Luteolibacter sp. TaxID=1962973 RepID=UPI00326595A4